VAVTRGTVPGRHPGADRGPLIDPSTLRRVLVVRADNIGDVVTTGPALRALRAVAPQARITLLASPAGARVAPLLPEVDAVLEASPSWQQLGSSGTSRPTHDDEWALLYRVGQGNHDAMIVHTSPTQSPWPAAHLGQLAGIPIRVVHSAEFGGAVATHWVTPPPDEGTHQVDRALHMLAAVGLAPANPVRCLSVRLPDDARATADAVLARSGLAPGKPFVALAPGASCPSRRYPADGFTAAAALIADAGIPVRVVGPASEVGLVAAVAGSHRDVRALNPTTVPGFAAILARASVALTNNSGGMHLADAVGTPVVVTWAGTDRAGDVGPRSVAAHLLRRPVGCSPCRLLSCPLHHECLDIAPEQVAEAVLRHISLEVTCTRMPTTTP
jgi:ADP-heptose:LPS heptosyltransferase